MAHWHGLAKLRMHNDLCLDILDSVTVHLGQQLRNFDHTTCAAFDTVELHREHQARLHRTVAKRPVPYNHQTAPDQEDITPTVDANTQNIPPAQHSGGRRRKKLNINTYKFHSYGDYAQSIRQHGTTDSYSTEPVHCVF